jgi:hypothetical protein
MQSSSGLLVSVRSAAEAAAALAGGASLIDVKEPRAGSLGRAAAATVAAVVRTVAGRTPISAALGELRQDREPLSCEGLDYLKWGLAGCADWPVWRAELAKWAGWLRKRGGRCRLVAVAYADWRRAQAPPPLEVCAVARELGCGAFLLDTWGKDGSTLLDWLPPGEIAALCHTVGVPVALAGSLGIEQVQQLLSLQPDWFAVRGAVCRGGREGLVDVSRVRELVNLLAGSLRAAKRGN